ncbi:MAG: tRNA pseudouridine(55) synthase TruB [Acidobacteriales bacterium]|nr:tRNA pseudouridine(55) synthase TruB [Terriglobales bacterium]
MDGVLVIDKPAGLTSHDVVARVRKILKQRSVGHLGTLDPLATGVLPIVVGRMTRLTQFYMSAEKQYEGEICFGVETDTYDAAGETVGQPKSVQLTLHEVTSAAKHFLGVIEQTPPPFSAKKIAGVPAYKLARKKKEVSLQPVKVEVKEFDILSLHRERAQFRARVASGTYLRSIAHDLGRGLGVGAHLAALRRTRVGEFAEGDAVTLESLESAYSGAADSTLHNIRYRTLHLSAQLADSSGFFIHPRQLLPEFPAVTATPEALAKVRHGNAVNLPEVSRSRYVKVFRGQTELVAIAMRIAGTLFQPKVVLLGDEVPAAIAVD